MPLKKTAADSGPEGATNLTRIEIRLIEAVMENMTQKPQTNWDKVATTMALKDARCAKERFRQIASRRGWGNQHQPASPTPTTGRRVTRQSVKRASLDQADEAATDTPRGKKKKKRVAEEEKPEEQLSAAMEDYHPEAEV